MPRRPATLEDATEPGRMREPPRTWFPLGTNLSSSSQGGTRSISEGSSLKVGNSSTQTKGRGPSLFNASWRSDEKIEVQLNDRGQPIMPEVSPLATNMGVLARDGSLLPLHYTDWRHVPAHYKTRVWNEIKAHTDADDSMEKWFMQSLGKKWQGWKCEAKRQGYTPFDNDADRIAHRPTRVQAEQWRCLVYYWSDKEVKESIKNKNYRSKQKLLHTSGRTPHYVVEQQEQEKNAGKKPTRIDVFLKTHTKKDGKEVNPETTAIVDKLKGLQCSGAMSSDAAFIEAIGPERPGRTRGCGLGATKTKMLSSQSSVEQHPAFLKMKSKMQKMKKFLEAMGYTDDTDDDLEESLPNENHQDASSAHCPYGIYSSQASPEETNPQPQLQTEQNLLAQPNHQSNSHCETLNQASGKFGNKRSALPKDNPRDQDENVVLPTANTQSQLGGSSQVDPVAGAPKKRRTLKKRFKLNL